MKTKIFNLRASVMAFAVLCAALVAWGAAAQTVTRLPVSIPNNATIVDFGNGPLELRILQGTAQIFTSQSSGVGSTSGSSTTLTLTATPLSVPCTGCGISGTGITAGTTVASYSGVTIVLSAAMTVPSSTAVSWGVACPSTISAPSIVAVPGVGTDLPLYTYARICGGAQFSAGASVLPFAIGAH